MAANRYARAFARSFLSELSLFPVSCGHALINTISFFLTEVIRFFAETLDLRIEEIAHLAALSVGPTYRFISPFTKASRSALTSFRIDNRDTVSTTGVNLQDRVRDDRWYAAASRIDRHDLIVFAVNDE